MTHRTHNKGTSLRRIGIVLVLCWLATASVAHAASVTLEWNAPTTGGAPTGYLMYRKVGNGAFALHATIAAGTLVYTDTAPQVGTNTYQVTAYNAGGESAPSNAVTFQVFQAPGAPSQLRVKP